MACGGGTRQDANEPSGNFPVRISTAQFPPRQMLAQSTDLRIGVENSGKKALPSLAVTISIAGKEGEDSILPFSARSPQPGLAQPDRPVWILENGYPKLADSSAPGGAATSNEKTFDFGPLAPGDTTTAVWHVTPVAAGDYTLTYRVDAGLGGLAKAVTSSGNPPQGSFHVNISDIPPRTRVNGKGQVVVIGQGSSSAKSK